MGLLLFFYWHDPCFRLPWLATIFPKLKIEIPDGACFGSPAPSGLPSAVSGIFRPVEIGVGT